MKNWTLLLVLTTAVASAQAGLNVEDVPTFQLRAPVTSVGGRQVKDEKFSFRFGVLSQTASATGTVWTDWLKFDKPQIEKTLKGYPAIYMRGFPVVVKLQVGGVIEPTSSLRE